MNIFRSANPSEPTPSERGCCCLSSDEMLPSFSFLQFYLFKPLNRKENLGFILNIYFLIYAHFIYFFKSLSQMSAAESSSYF